MTDFRNSGFTSRGLRNNNAGNIRINSANAWKGKVKGTDTAFETFESIEYGLRALFILLKNYNKQGFNTIEKIINKYAPANENNTKSYIDLVVTKTGVNKNTILDFNNKVLIISIAKSIILMENKKDEAVKVTDSIFNTAYSMAYGSFNPTATLDKMAEDLKNKCPQCGLILPVVVFFYSLATYFIIIN